MIVNAGGGDIGVAKPFLHLGDVSLVVQRVSRRRRPQRMRADLEPELHRVGARGVKVSLALTRPRPRVSRMITSLSFTIFVL
jgi:hypothetical protein